MIQLGLLALLMVVCAVQAAPSGDLVKNLPGLTFQPRYKTYSGYLQATGDKKLHYWFVESASSPYADAVVMWMNGGPGCSSMEGFLKEHGPFLINSDGKTLRQNKFSWNTQANVLYLEAPAGVGYSFSQSQNYSTNDDLVSLDNFYALRDFFRKFPEFRRNPFFITGESYGGIYVPTLSVRVLADKTINFQGFAVGNGITDFKWNDNSLIYFGYYHGLISPAIWMELMLSCCPATQEGACDIVGNKNHQCQSVVNKVVGMVRAPDINMYNLYAKCLTSGTGGRQADGRFVYYDIPYLFKDHKQVMEERKSVRLVAGANLQVAPPCLNATELTDYMNQASVRKALHVPLFVQKFELCSGVVGAHYKTIYQNTKQFYASVMAAKKRILLYNGDVDMACNFLGDEWFVGTLGIQKTKPRQQWMYTDPATGTAQVAGFVDQYPYLTYTTIRGAGHMVPQDRPKPALDMIMRFIKNQPF